jgi:signal transduction histidine kinase
MSSTTGDIGVFSARPASATLAAMNALALPVTRPWPEPRLVAWRRSRSRTAVVATLSDVERSSRTTRLAGPAVVAYSAVFPVLQVAVIAQSWQATPGDAAWAVAATAVFLPLHLHHVAHAVRGRRPPHGVWTLAAMTVPIVAVVPMLDGSWLPTMHALIVSALIVLRPRWALLVSAVVVIAQVPLGAEMSDLLPGAPSYYALTVVWRASSVFVPIWLVGAIVQLQAARQALAREAVVRERVRIDDELRHTLGTALEGIVAQGERAAGAVAAGAAGPDRAGPGAAVELRSLVDGSRRALADARQLVRGYGRDSLRSEVDTAAGLLRAAGVAVRIDLPPGPLPAVVDDGARAALRLATSRLLAADGVRACTIAVTHEDGRVALDVRPDVASGAGAAS